MEMVPRPPKSSKRKFKREAEDRDHSELQQDYKDDVQLEAEQRVLRKLEVEYCYRGGERFDSGPVIFENHCHLEGLGLRVWPKSIGDVSMERGCQFLFGV